MKKINVIYWISTVLLCLVMGGGAIPSVLNQPQSVAMLNQLHYPVYFGLLIGIAKILGSIAILVPGFPKLKEWAYAGFTFDLIGATWSAIAIGTPLTQVAPMLIFFALLAVSYIYHHKRLDAKQPAINQGA